MIVVPDYVANGGANVWWGWTILESSWPTRTLPQVSKVMQETVRRMLELADERGT